MLKSKINLRIVHVAPCRSTTSLECSDPLEILDAAMRCPQGGTQMDPTVSKPRPFCYGLKANRVHPCENLKAALDGERNSATPNHAIWRDRRTGQRRMLELIQTTHRNAAQPTHQLQRIEAPRPLEHSAAPAAGGGHGCRDFPRDRCGQSFLEHRFCTFK